MDASVDCFVLNNNIPFWNPTQEGCGVPSNQAVPVSQNQPQQPVGSEYRPGSKETKIFNYFWVEIEVRLFSEHQLTWTGMGTSRRKNL